MHMHPLAKRIALLVALFSFIIGLFLLGSNLRIIPTPTVGTVLNLWPLLLVLAGIMLVIDSTKKRVVADGAGVVSTEHLLPLDERPSEISLKIQFSYGRLVVTRGEGAPRLVTETTGPSAAPGLKHQTMGEREEVTIALNQPLFPDRLKMKNTWRLELPPGIPLRFSLQLHEADLHMDLRSLLTESIELRTESGSQELLLGRPRQSLSGFIYAAGSSLSVVLPAHVFSWVRLLNPFCRVDYPQGDLEKRLDGSLITPSAADARGSVEIEVDGPLRNLVLDIEDTAET
jgi:hypothetical protein